MMKIPKGIVFTKFNVGPYEIYVFQDEDGVALTVKAYEYEEY